MEYLVRESSIIYTEAETPPSAQWARLLFSKRVDRRRVKAGRVVDPAQRMLRCTTISNVELYRAHHVFAMLVREQAGWHPSISFCERLIATYPFIYPRTTKKIGHVRK